MSMEKYRLPPRGYGDSIFGIVSILLAISVTLASMYYQRPSDPFCQGRLSAGFPAAVICDASGESPLSSVGKIDWADLDSINPLGFLVDIGFYTVTLWLSWLILRRISHLVRRRTQS